MKQGPLVDIDKIKKTAIPIKNNNKKRGIEMFAILRTKKIQYINLKKAQEHNLRIRHAYNVDKSKSYLNEILIDEFDIKNNRNLEQALTDYYKNKKVTSRKNSVPMLEFVLTASPGFFEKADKKKIEDWKNSQIEFVKQEWGEAVKFATLHMDEKSPHLHIMISTEHKTVKKYKNQFGEFHKEGWSLNVKRFDRDYLRDLQTRYAKHNERFNLKRGMYDSQASHKTLKQFYKEVGRAQRTNYTTRIMNYFDKLKSNFFGVVSTKTVIEQLFPMVESIVKQNKTYKTFLDNYSKNVAVINKQIEENKKRELELEKEKIELEERRKIYKEAINGKSFNIDKIREQQELIKELKEENEKMKLKYEKPKHAPQQQHNTRLKL